MNKTKEQQANAIYELWDIALQHRWRFVLPAFLMTALVLGACLLLPRKYQASANFERRNDPILTEMTNSGAVSSYMDPTGSLMKEIASGPAIAKVVDALEPKLYERGYLQTQADLVDLRQTVMQQLVVHREYADQQRVQVRLELVLDDPDVAAMVVNALVETYMEKTSAEHAGRLAKMADTFRVQADAHRENLETLENEMLAFEIDHAELLPEHPHSIQSQLGSAQEELTRLLTELEGATLRLAGLREAIDAEPETLPSVMRGRNPELERLSEKLRSIEDEITEHISVMRMRETHPDVVALREQAQQVRDEIAALDTDVVTSTSHEPNPKRAELEVRLTSVLADRDLLSQQIALRRNRIDELNASSTQLLPVRSDYRRLQTAVEAAHRDIAYWEDRLRGVEMSQTAESGQHGVQLTFIRRAESGHRPVSPNLAQALLAALFLGCACGALSVFFAHRTDDSFRNASQLNDAFSLPLLGSVSELITRKHRRTRKTRRYLLYPCYGTAMAAVLLLVGGMLYLDLEQPDTLLKLKIQTRDWVGNIIPGGNSGITGRPETEGANDGLHF
ncbi:MAG: GumC family protein [Phycisphaerales bacterium JB063]